MTEYVTHAELQEAIAIGFPWLIALIFACVFYFHVGSILIVKLLGFLLTKLKKRANK